MSLGGGGAGGSGTQKYEWNESLKPYWEKALGASEGIATKPYTQYTGERIAPFSTDQNWAMQSYRALASNPGQVWTNTEDTLANLAGGNTLWKDGKPINVNPWSETTVKADNSNPLGQSQTQVGVNKYAGTESPFFQGQVQKALGNLAEGYHKGASADTRRLFNMSGAFGGSAHQAAINNNQQTLANTMNDTINKMYSDQYDKSIGLEESDINRRISAGQFDKNLANSVYSDWASRDLQAQQFNKSLGSQNWEAERGRQIGAIPQTFQFYQSAQDRYKPLMAVGDAQQQLMQQALNQQFADWTQAQQYPQSQLDWLTGMFARAQGGVSPTMTQTQSAGSVNPVSALLGAGALYGAMG